MQTQPRSGFWREADGSTLTSQDAYAAWAEVAYPRLIAVASAYQGFITYKDLADALVQDTGIETSQLMMSWISQVLKLVVAETRRRGDPQLTALVVRGDNHMVGDGYKTALTAAGQAPIEDDFDREDHAAGARLECYQRFCAEMPADGGTPTLAPKLHAKRYGKQSLAEVSTATCPTCFLTLPVSKVCDNCG